MTIPFACVVLALLLIYLFKVPVAIAMLKQKGGYDNKHPREQQAQLTGWGARALAAHRNSFEVFPPFAAAVIIAHLTGVEERIATFAAVTFVASRVGYGLAYIANADRLRSSLWFIGMGAIFALLLAPWIW